MRCITKCATTRFKEVKYECVLSKIVIAEHKFHGAKPSNLDSICPNVCLLNTNFNTKNHKIMTPMSKYDVQIAPNCACTRGSPQQNSVGPRSHLGMRSPSTSPSFGDEVPKCKSQRSFGDEVPKPSPSFGDDVIWGRGPQSPACHLGTRSPKATSQKSFGDEVPKTPARHSGTRSPNPIPSGSSNSRFQQDVFQIANKFMSCCL